MRPMTRAEVRGIDRRAIEEYGIPGMVLMENAGRGAADVAMAMVAGIDAPRVAILCGKGNNGGDGFVMARHLHNRGVPVDLFYAGRAEDAGDGDGAANMRIALRMGLPFEEVADPSAAEALAGRLDHHDLVVDALLGTGLIGEVREPARSLIRAINAAGKPVLAADIPSGLDCDEGVPLGEAVRATRTATFAAAKVGFSEADGARHCGRVTVVDIGVPASLLESLEAPGPQR